MANIGVGENKIAYLVKYADVTNVDSMLSTSTPVEEIVRVGYMKRFKYRHLTQNEMTYQPISNWLKGKEESVLYTSETDILPKERDKVYFESSEVFLSITKVIPQSHHGAFLVNGKHPHILELS